MVVEGGGFQATTRRFCCRVDEDVPGKEWIVGRRGRGKEGRASVGHV